MLASFVFVAVLAAVANADHRITLRNNCEWGVGLTLSNFPHAGVDYTGPAIGDIGAKSSRDITVPTRWNGRICDRPPNSGCENDCFGGIAFGRAACSMTEFTFDSPNLGGQHDYDISNIQGYSVAQQIIPDSGAVVTCTDVNCPCNQAYRPGDTSGTCGGTGPVDQATRVSGSSGFTIVYCP
ncbi:COP8 protein [Favolaschia claudopus]|uniref:COP8 protein n=1 Tax=Favolaschia claudopus TaxID=2862362 RepID=A0AAW0CI95_9AGAR